MSVTESFVDDYLPALLAQAAQLMAAEFNAIVDAHGLSGLEWRILATLAGSGPLTVGSLAQKSVSKQPTVTRLLDRMEQLGHVERLADRSDRRITLVRMTRSGNRMMSALIREARDHEAAVLAPLGANRSQLLKDVLRRLIASRLPSAPRPQQPFEHGGGSLPR
jgi:DNA-binding MarR family transcriptional regulator